MVQVTCGQLICLSQQLRTSGSALVLKPAAFSKLGDHRLPKPGRNVSMSNYFLQIYGIVKAVTKAMPHIASTSDLPRNIEPFPGDKRSLHVRELYTTEFTYVAGLEVLVEVCVCVCVCMYVCQCV